MGHLEVGLYKCQLIKMPRIFLFFDELKSNSSQILKLRVASSVLGDIEFLKLIMIFLIGICKLDSGVGAVLEHCPHRTAPLRA